MGFFTKGITLPQKSTQLSLELIDTPLPKKVILPVQQYLGEPATPTLAVGDKVKVGEVIATGEGAHTLPLHAPYLAPLVQSVSNWLPKRQHGVYGVG